MGSKDSEQFVRRLQKILQSDGLLSQSLKGFQSRPQQQRMMQNIADAYLKDEIALIEAGTGTGKTIAYLLPALFWAAQKKETTLISTNTIALQEQLLHKDIPMLTNVLQLDVKAVLVKGMNNYLCLRKLDDLQRDVVMLSSEEKAEIDKIALWRQHTIEGARSDLPFQPSQAVWEKVNVESDTCTNVQCPHYQKCYFFKARKEAQDARLLVVNHHMLFADLARRAETDNYKEPSVLPLYNRLIIDEAHHIEEIATEYFALKLSKLEIMRTLSKLATENPEKSTQKVSGVLPLLRHKVQMHYGNNLDSTVQSIISRLTVDLPGSRRDLYKVLGELFQLFSLFAQQTNSERGENSAAAETKLRLLPAHYNHQEWLSRIVPQIRETTFIANQYIQSIHSICRDITSLKNEKLSEELKNTLHDITAFAERLEESFITLNQFMTLDTSEERVRWIEANPFNTHLINAELDIASSLARAFFLKFDTIVLCSATLTTNQSFDFMRQRLGLTAEHIGERAVGEYRYDSPFDYKKQSLLAVPIDIPAPTDPRFTAAAVEQILHTLQTCRGNAFVLFTSYTMLKQCHEMLAKQLEEKRFKVFKQGDESRLSLLKKFKEADSAVLFGTDSFWEGIDIVGENLRCVIIVKLPFKVPTEPIIQARTEAIVAKGGDAFNDYAVPNAIVKFKQGFGRLIRGHNDRGCIICLDNRIVSKGYGKLFLNSLPDCQRIFASSSEVQQVMSEFYRKTYHLVKKG